MGWIEEVRRAADIVDIISEYVSLKKVGSSYRGLCPFHSEKTPSFYVSPSRNIWKCFGCGKGGDVIKFVAEIENISYTEAAKLLARRYGIEVPFEEEKEENTSEISVLQKVASVYQHALVSSPEARGYLKERNIPASLIKEEKLGFAAPASSKYSLLRMLEGDKEAIKTLSELKHLKLSASGLRDIFEGRIVAPVYNDKGRIVGFTGRLVPGVLPPEIEKKSPKYLNSPSSRIFNKSRAFIGLSPETIRAIRQSGSVIIVEGLFDVLRIKALGKKNVIAPMGTALTLQHVEAITKLAAKLDVYLCFDGDEAGRKAIARAAFLFAKAGVVPKVVLLPRGEDPDTYFSKVGYKGLTESLANAKYYPALLLDEIEKASDPAARAELIREFFDVVKQIANVEQKEAWLIEYRIRFKKDKRVVSGQWPPAKVLEEENLDGVEADFLLGLFHGLEPKTGELLKELEELLLSKRAYELAVDILTGNLDSIPGWLAKGPVLALELRYKSAKETLRSRTLNAVSALDLEIKLREMKNKITHPSQLTKYRLLAGGPKAFLYDALAKMILRNPESWHLPDEIAKRLKALLSAPAQSEELTGGNNTPLKDNEELDPSVKKPNSGEAEALIAGTEKEGSIKTHAAPPEDNNNEPVDCTTDARPENKGNGSKSDFPKGGDMSAEALLLNEDNVPTERPKDVQGEEETGFTPSLNLDNLLGDAFRFETGFG